VSGNVVANYTADGKPYPISLDVAKPPYTFNLTTSSAPVDDSGHPFPGNLGEAEDLLAVQCWNTTVHIVPSGADSQTYFGAQPLHCLLFLLYMIPKS